MTEVDIRVGQRWRTPDGKRLTVTGIVGDSIDCNRYDPETHVSDAFVPKRAEFAEFELLEDPPD